MEISLFFMFYVIDFGHVLKREISENAISPPQMTENKSAVKQHFQSAGKENGAPNRPSAVTLSQIINWHIDEFSLA